LNARPADLSAAVQELPDGYDSLIEGVLCCVVIKRSVRKEIMKKATKEKQAGLEDVIQHYAAGGPQGIPPAKFAGDEGWFPSKKDKRIRLEAFKPWQLRAYGFCEEFNGRQTFFITGVDTRKKQFKADQEILEAAGKEAVRIHDLLKQRR
jgi:hypothetical protein